MFFLENRKCSIFFWTFFFKIIFDQKKIFFFDGIFFKAHLLVEDNHFEAVSERSQQYKTKKNYLKKNLRKKAHISRIQYH